MTFPAKRSFALRLPVRLEVARDGGARVSGYQWQGEPCQQTKYDLQPKIQTLELQFLVLNLGIFGEKREFF